MTHESKHTLMKSGKMRRAMNSEVCNQVKKAWNSIAVKTIKKPFQKAKIIEDENCNDNTTSSEDESNKLSLREDFLNLFNSESDDTEFEGFH